MSEVRDYIYIRTDPVPEGAESSVRRQHRKSDLAQTRAHLKEARRNHFNIDRRNAVTEQVSAALAASGRPQFVKLLRKLGPYTGLVVWHLDGLGRDATDILRTIDKVRAQGAEIYCMDVHIDDMSRDEASMRMLRFMADLERKTGKTLGIPGRGPAGGRIGRPPSLDDATKAQVRASLAKGDTVSEVARRFNTSRQTVLRIRDASPQA